MVLVLMLGLRSGRPWVRGHLSTPLRASLGGQMVVRYLFGLTSMGSMLRVAKGLQTFTDRTAREIVRSVTRPQGAPSYFTDPKAPAPRVPKLNTYVEARAVRRPLAEVLRKVNDFAHGLHSDW